MECSAQPSAFFPGMMSTLESLTSHIESAGELDAPMIANAVEALLDESNSVVSRANFLIALHRRGETPAEIAGFVENLLSHAVDPGIRADEAGGPLIDVCGTGGDRLGLFNISTAVMFVAAACGVRVVKHGNRGITSKAGGADVLEALGVPITLSADQSREVLLRHGATFLFAPHYHPAFKAVAPVRKFIAEQGETSLFNILGPLLNPARPPYQLAGIFDPRLLDIYADILRCIGRNRAWVVNGRIEGSDSGMDEVSTLGATDVAILEGGGIRRSILDASEYGLPRAELEDLAGGDANHNAAILHGILSGDIKGAPREIVVANSAAALTVAGLAEAFEHGMELANRALHDKNALRVLDAMRGA